MVKLRHFDNLGTARFITFSCYHRLCLLNSDNTIIPFLEALEIYRRKYVFHIYGYIVMPDHVHLVLYPLRNMAMGSVIGEIKKRSSYKILSLWKKQNRAILREMAVSGRGRQQFAFWQPRGYDRNCRTSEIVREKIHYCHMNPVKAGLVTDPGDWPWSSYRWYCGDERSLVQIECLEL